MSTITPLSGIPPVGSYTPRQGAPRPEGPLAHNLGEIIKATVLEARSADRYLLDIGGNRLLASSQAVLTPGQHLQLQLVSTTPQVQLRIVSDVFSVLAGRSLVLLGNTIDLANLMATLTGGTPPPFSRLSPASASTLTSFFPDGLQQIMNSREGGEFLRHLFNRLGLNLESILAQGGKEQAPQTLKAALLEIAHLFQHSERITEQTGRLLATLELYQLAQLQLSQDRLLIFPLPLPFLDQGYLLVEQQEESPDRPADQPDEYRFSLHLSLTGLGPLKIVFLLNQEGLFIRFSFDSKDKAAFAAQFENDLHQMLSGAPLVSVTFSDGAEDPARELVRRLIPQERSILDTTA